MGSGFIYLICAGITVIFMAALGSYVERKFGRKQQNLALKCFLTSIAWPLTWLMIIGIALGSFFGSKKQ